MGTTCGRNGRKKSILQGGIGVPFIARWPDKIKQGAVDEVMWISVVDLLPTFREIARVMTDRAIHDNQMRCPCRGAAEGFYCDQSFFSYFFRCERI